MAKLGEYLAVALVETARKQSAEISTNRKELQQLLSQYWDVVADEEDITEAVRILNMCDISYVEDDEFAGTFIVISVERFDKFISKALGERDKYDQIILGELDQNLAIDIAESREYPSLERYNKFKVLRKYAAFGSSWIETAMEQIVQQKKDGNLGIPASDRIVSFGDNEPKIEQIKAQATELEKKLRLGNDLGEITREQADAVADEVLQFKQSFSAKDLRPSEIRRRATATLKWIAEKAAGTAVGDAATFIMKLIIELLG